MVLHGLIEVAAGGGEIAEAVVAGSEFAQGLAALLNSKIAEQRLLVIRDGLGEIAAARHRVGHEEQGRRFFIAVGKGAIDDVFEHIDGTVEADASGRAGRGGRFPG